MNYTNAQFRSILNGLGHREKTTSDSINFPVTSDNSPLTDDRTVQAIKNFQAEYGLAVDGIAGSKTMAKAEQVMKILHNELNATVNAGLPQDQPFYGSLTVASVKKFQAKFLQDGVASNPVRLELYDVYLASTQIA